MRKTAMLGLRSAMLMSAAWGGLASAAFAQGDGASEGARERDTIVVTAQKREQSLLDVPMAITVIDGQSLEESGASNLNDYAAYIPGFTYAPNGVPGQGSVTLRGLSPLNSTSTIGTYIDEAPVGGSGGWVGASAFSLDTFPYDIQRTEVLKGPQGTLYGANAMGGLIKYVTRKPNLDEYEARVGGSVFDLAHASDMGWSARGAVSGPIIPGKLGIRLSGFTQTTPGYIDNAATGDKDLAEAKQHGARFSALWQPMDSLSVNLQAIWQEVNADGRTSVRLTADLEPFGDPYDMGRSLTEEFSQELQLYSGTIEWDLGGPTLTSSTSYSKYDNTRLIDVTTSYSPYATILSNAFTGMAVVGALTPNLNTYNVERFNQEVRLASPSGGAFEWLIGGYFDTEDGETAQYIDVLDSSGVIVPFFPSLAEVTLPSSYKEYAVFGNVTIKLVDQFDVTGGLRWSKNKQDFTQNSSGPLFVFLGVGGSFPGVSKEDVLTFSVSPRFKPTENMTLYARVASGYRPGRPNATLPNVPQSVDSDSTINYELGFKANLLDSKIIVDASAFYIDWSDIQVTNSAGGVSWSENGGKAVAKGFEFSTILEPIDNLSIGLNTTYTKANLTEDVPQTGWLDGDILPFSPEWAASITADYSVPINAEWTGAIGGGWRYASGRWSAISSSAAAVYAPSYDLFDLRASISNDRLKIGFFAKNLFDAYVIQAPFARTTGVVYDAVIQQPRTLGVSLDASF